MNWEAQRAEQFPHLRNYTLTPDFSTVNPSGERKTPQMQSYK